MAATDTTPATARCRQCGSQALDDLGSIPPGTRFAGQALDPPWPGGTLYVCRRCHLGFRHPVRDEAEYEGLYAQASESIWVTGELRADQRLVADRIAALGGALDVLDVGCYDGALLAALPTRVHKHGIEASTTAAAKARERGVEIVGQRIRDVTGLAQSFDVVCAVDVIEHVPQPKRFVEMLAARLRPGGLLLVSTGSVDSDAWRAAGGRYWYCSYPEHISFVSPAWARLAASELGLTLAEAHRFAYGNVDPSVRGRLLRRFRRRLAGARIERFASRWLGALGVHDAPTQRLGEPGLFVDHVLLTFRPGALPAPPGDLRVRSTAA